MSIHHERRDRALAPLCSVVVLVLSLGLNIAACGEVTKPAADAGVVTPDALTIADAMVVPDARAPMTPPPPDTAELVSAAGSVSGGGYQAQVQLGHWNIQGGFSGGNYSGQGASAITP